MKATSWLPSYRAAQNDATDRLPTRAAYEPRRPDESGRPGSNRRRLAWEATLPTVSDPRLRRRPLSGASKRRRCRARQAYQGVTPNDPGPLVTRSLEVATPPSTGAVSLESAQHLTGRKSPHAVVVFVGERFAQGAGPLLVAREPIAPQRGLRPRRDLGRQRDRRVERGARRDQPVRESHAKRFFTGYPAAGQDEDERVAVSDQPSEPNRAAVHQWNAPAPAVHTEDRVLRGDAEIAPRRKLEAAGDRVPFDGGDDRLGKQHAGRPDRAVAVAAEAARPLHP